MRLSLGKTSKNMKHLIGLVFMLVVVGAAQPFLWRFVAVQARSLQIVRSQAQHTREISDRSATLEADIAGQRDFLNQLDVVVPPEADLTQAVERLEQLADQQGILIDITSIVKLADLDSKEKPVVSVGEIIPAAVTIKIYGTVAQLLQYIDRVEHLQELTVVRSLNLKPNTIGSAVPVGAAPPAPYTLDAEVLFFLSAITSDDSQ